MPAPDSNRQLVGRFESNLDSYKLPKYNEARARRGFIDPFFAELGWDMENKQGIAEAYKDVIYEDRLEIEEETKAPDYAFRIGGTRKFFVEAKKPSVKLEADIHPAFQLRRYAWSAKLPLSLLTDFEEFVVYDCRIKPDKTDKASTGRVTLLKQSPRMPQEKESLQRELEATGGQIARLVYELYGLAEEEINIVEGKE